MASDHDFEELLDGVRRGDDRAASELFRLMHPPLLRYLRSRERRTADDIAADVWLAISTGLGSFEGTSEDFRAWMFLIAHRRLIDQRRQTERRLTGPAAPDTFESIPDPSADDEVTSAHEAQDAVDRIVSLLSQEQADVVLLRVLGGLDAVTVAEILGRTPGWVRVTQHRALRRLAAQLRPILSGLL